MLTFPVVWEIKHPFFNSKLHLSYVHKPKSRQGQEQLKLTRHVDWESKNITSLKTLPLTYTLNPNQDKDESNPNGNSIYYENPGTSLHSIFYLSHRHQTQIKTRMRATQVEISCTLKIHEPHLTQKPISHIVTKPKSSQSSEEIKWTFNYPKHTKAVSHSHVN